MNLFKIWCTWVSFHQNLYQLAFTKTSIVHIINSFGSGNRFNFKKVEKKYYDF